MTTTKHPRTSPRCLHILESVIQLTIILLSLVLIGTPDAYGMGNITALHMVLQITGCCAGIALLAILLKAIKK